MTAEPIGDRRRLEPLPGGGFAYVLVDDAVRVEARYIRRESNQVHGEVDVQCEWAGASRHGLSLSCADVNLSSQPARKTLAKYCAERAHSRPEDFDWMGAIDAACQEVIRASRESEDVITLDDAPYVAERDLKVAGLQIPADGTSMLIAHGDSLKSMITLYVLGSLAQRGQNVLFLDWEWTAARHLARKCRLFGTERLDSLKYLHCRAPIVIECDRIRRYCDQEHIEFIAVDSVGLASDGKLIDDDVAIRFHRALASLPPALCAAHVPKSSLGPDGKGDAIGPFGSVFFSNLCRASWLVKKQLSATDDVVTVGLFPQKQNDGARTQPVGLEFTFSPEVIQVHNVDLADVDGLACRLPLAARMRHLLKRGPMTYTQIADELSAKVDTVVKAANRSRTFTKVSGQDGVTRIALVEAKHVA
jgi:hypothetical protein